MNRQILAFCVILSAAAPAFAQTAWEDLAELDARVAAATGAAIGTPGGAVAPIDRRLKLPRCPGEVAVDPAANGASAVRCPALGWRVRVPLALGTQAMEIAVRRGDIVDVEYDGEGFSASASGVALDDAAIGRTFRVKTSTGQPITAVAAGAGKARVAP